MKELMAFLIRRPFLPFMIHLSDQSKFEDRNPRLVSVGTRATFIGIPRDNVKGETWDEPVIVYNIHIARIEPIIESAPAA